MISLIEPVCTKNDDQFCQDRRGTNTGKVERRDRFFAGPCGVRAALAGACFYDLSRPLHSLRRAAPEPRHPDTGGKDAFLEPFYTIDNEMIMLPRQARDKHRESTQKKMRRSVSICLKPTRSSSGDTTQVQTEQPNNKTSHKYLQLILTRQTPDCSVNVQFR